MKAHVLNGVNQLDFFDVEKPTVLKGEVLVRVRATGICGSDIPRIYKTGTYHFPTVPGHEFSGEVVELGEGVDADRLGKRVGIFPLIPCGNCEPCRRKYYEMCRNYSYLGSRRDGGFAEYVTVPEKNLIELPKTVSFEAAAMLEPMAVAVHAMRKAKVCAADRIAVCGLGTIGLLLVRFLRDAGCKNIFVIGNKDFQRTMAMKSGIPKEAFCDSRRASPKQWLLEKTDGVGVDVFFECVGRQETYAQAVELTAPAGTVMLVGNPHTDMTLEKGVYWKILRNQLNVKGTWNSSFTGEEDDDWHYVLERLQAGAITPEELITHRVPLNRLESGLLIMRDKAEEYVKIMAVL